MTVYSKSKRHYATHTGPRLIISQFASTCKVCGGPIAQGESAIYTPGEKGVTHPQATTCDAVKAALTPQQAALEAERLAGNWRAYTSKYPNTRCILCTGLIAQGSDFWWRKGATKSESRHIVCPLVIVPAPAPAWTPAPVVKSVIPDGKYTLVIGDEAAGEEAYLTFRVSTAKTGKHAGTTRIGVRNGHGFTNIGIVSGSEIRPYPTVYEWHNWSTGENGPVVEQNKVDFWLTVAGILLTGEGVYLQAGLLYAMKSNECWRCGHALTVPVSLHRGVGPDCAKALGLT